MYTFLIVIHIIASLVLVFVILLQSGRGGGLSEAFGFGSTSTLFGASAQTFLQRATSVCAILFLLTSLSLAILSSRQSRSLMEMQRLRGVLPPAQRETLPTDSAIPPQPDETTAPGPSEAMPVEAPEGVSFDVPPVSETAPIAVEPAHEEMPKPE